MLVDSGSFVNLFSGVPLGSVKLVSGLESCSYIQLTMAQLQYEASKTLEILNEATIAGDPFTQVFLKDNRDLSTRFDIVLRYVNLSAYVHVGLG